MKPIRIKLITVFVGLLVALLLPGQPANAQEGVVYGVLLYSPECPHCHEFINNDWPMMQEQFGDQFQVLFINVLTEEGQRLAQELYQHYEVPERERYVPMMFIGEHVLVGGNEIPERGSEIVQQGIASGGITMPPVPAIDDVFTQALADADTQANGDGPAGDSDSEPITSSTSTGATPGIPNQQDTLWQRLSRKMARDPIANALAVMVLLGLTVSMIAVTATGVTILAETDSTQPDNPDEEEYPLWLDDLPGQALTVLSAVIGIGLALALLVRTGDDVLALVMSAGATLGLIVVAVLAIIRPEARLAAIFVAAAAGLLVAVYLSVVEVGGSEAVCGAVGDCTTVQDSPYAILFGVLPVGVAGIMGYLIMGIAGIVALIGGSTRLGDWGRIALLILALFGVGFSAYLTFLEPFVIGATCFWCLTSAMVMLVILWLVAPIGWQSLERVLGAV